MIEYPLFFQFVKDYKFPVQRIKDQEYLEYAMDLLESETSIKTEWTKLQEFVAFEFSGNSSEYLQTLVKIRNDMMEYVKSLPGYKEFNTGKMDPWVIKDRPAGISSRDIYNCSRVGGTYLSVDLKKANFQALMAAGVFKETEVEQYEDLVRKFTDLDYFIGSKHIRQVVFGQLNVGRQITVEKYLINEVRKALESKLPEQYELISQMDDEVVWDTKGIILPDPHTLEEDIIKSLGISVRAETYKLSGYSLEPKKNSEFYIRTDCYSSQKTLKCVPSTYYLMIKKLLEGKELCDFDIFFEHDGLKAKFSEEFNLKKL